MRDATAVAGWLLVVGPLAGAIPIAHPALMRVWSAPREQYLAIIGAHVRAWYLLNAGFTFATVLTSAGLVVLAAAADPASIAGALLSALAVAYAMCGLPWVAMLAIRARRDPLLAGMVAAGQPTEPAESITGAAVGGLFGAFALGTAITLVALAAVLAIAGVVAVPVAVVGGAVAILVLVIQLRTGDCIPAILYLPTLFVGLALLAGWT